MSASVKTGANGTIIKEQNKARITAFIDEAEGRSSMRCLTYVDIENAIARIENRLNIPRKAMEGLRYSVDVNAQTFPSAYKYRAESTHMVIEYSKGQWRLMSVSRDTTRRQGHEFACINMPEETRNAIISRMVTF